MSAQSKKPAIVGVASVLLSVGLGLALTWRTLSTVKIHVPEVVVEPDTSELRQKGWDFWTIEIDNLSNELKDERLRLRKQAELLDLRAARVAAEEKEFAKLRGEVEALRKKVEDKVIEIAADEAKNIRSLASTYSTLTPKAAVAILREMDDNTFVKILFLMKSDVVGPIFEEMTKTAGPDGLLAKRAALLSEKLRLMKSAKATTS